jgi:hypothetical protein
MRTSNPASYDKIFQIYGASGTSNKDTVISPHRGLLLVNSSASVDTTVTVKNIDNTEITLAIASGATVLPLQVQGIGISSPNTNIRIYGLY